MIHAWKGIIVQMEQSLKLNFHVHLAHTLIVRTSQDQKNAHHVHRDFLVDGRPGFLQVHGSHVNRVISAHKVGVFLIDSIFTNCFLFDYFILTMHSMIFSAPSFLVISHSAVLTLILLDHFVSFFSHILQPLAPPFPFSFFHDFVLSMVG